MGISGRCSSFVDFEFTNFNKRHFKPVSMNNAEEVDATIEDAEAETGR